ncbi:unnamed protein product [Cyclocybe aegerita]|uniref:DUF6532 domain-containing protein n=1 Tax=Cyclocybe aegerita TaxID=1973307 RepID=A0A8S0W039_CYCAE|nr:unnamed protein product [Cyclocybe aegerita]
MAKKCKAQLGPSDNEQDDNGLPSEDNTIGVRTRSKTGGKSLKSAVPSTSRKYGGSKPAPWKKKVNQPLSKAEMEKLKRLQKRAGLSQKDDDDDIDVSKEPEAGTGPCERQDDEMEEQDTSRRHEEPSAGTDQLSQNPPTSHRQMPSQALPHSSQAPASSVPVQAQQIAATQSSSRQSSSRPQPQPHQNEISESENDEQGIIGRKSSDSEEEEEDDEDLDDEEENALPLATNGISVSPNPTVAVKAARCQAIGTRTPKKERCSGKVVEADFSPNTLVLAKAAKRYTQERAAFGEAFPPQDAEGREAFMMTMFEKAAKKGDNKLDRAGVNEVSGLMMKTVLQCAAKSSEVYDKLSIFAMYGKRDLTATVVKRTREMIGAGYGIPGKLSQDEIIDLVKWLLQGSRFRCNGLDFQNKTFDAEKPFLHPIIGEIIKRIWFMKAKSDQPALSQMIWKKKVFAGVIILITTCVEHCLKGWSGGSELIHHFSEANCSDRYAHFTALWEEFAEGAPDFMQAVEEATYDNIICGIKNIALITTVDKKEVKASLHGVNLAALNARAAALSARSQPEHTSASSSTATSTAASSSTA